MFNYIRIFSIISLLFILWAAYFVGLYYKHVASEDVVQMAEKNSAALVQGYINTIWKEHHNTLVRLSRIEVDKWANYREFQLFRRDTVNYFAQMPVNEIRIYLKNGKRILSTSPVTRHKNENLYLTFSPFTEALKGENGIKVLEDKEYILPNGDKKQGSLVSTYVPVFAKNHVRILADNEPSKVEAVIRVDYDITEEWKQLITFQYMAGFGIVSIFLLILTFLIFFSRRAEAIIAKQHEINLELTAAAAAAESENRDKSMFLANISHELRTPLNAIIGFSEILSNELATRLEQQHREYIRDINSSGKHLLSLINDILEFSKAEAGKLEVDLSEIDGVKMVKNSIRLMIPRAEEAQVTLLEDLPKQAFILHTDAKKLKQVLLNLLSNAVKFTPPNGQVKVTAWQDAVRGKAIFIVSDTGIGIAPKDISKVMAPFGQVESELSRRYEGTGLGLPLSKRLVELLGGTFTIESEVGVGTTITLEFPMRLERDKIKH